MSAYSFLATKRIGRENHRSLNLMTLSQSGDQKAITQQFERWEKDD